MNTNLIHNILNVMIVIIAGLAGFDWQALGLDPALAAKIVSVLAAAKLFMNAIRDGLAGLIKKQPPVQ
jgi:hypothetical protein